MADKKTSPWLWVALGCGGIVVLGGILVVVGTFIAARKVSSVATDMQKNPTKFMAEMMVRSNPDVDLVESTDKSVTVRDKKTGETMTWTFEQDENGKMTFTGPDGEVTFDSSAVKEGGEGGAFITAKGKDGEQTFSMTAGKGGEVPDWVPRYPGADEEQAAWAMKATKNGKDATTGAVAFKTDDAAKKAIERYAKILEDEGYEVQKVVASGTQGAGGTVTGQKDGRTVSAIVGEDEGKTQLLVQYASGTD